MPAFGTAEAEAVEKARGDMLRDGKPLNRTRIGADALCEALVRQGVEVIFGYPGGVILPLYDVWADHPELRTILVRHEQGAAHAADGYARASGRVGVCLGTSGPGATNLVTGIATAQLDSVPMVAITGNVPGALIGKDAFQEIDISGITLPMTKHNYLVRKADDIPRVIAEAFHIARTGRPGPVHVDLTKDALTSETQAQHPDTLDLPGFKPRFDGHPRQITLAAREIAEAKRPVILAGHGVLIANASDELRQLAEKAQIPVTHTLLGRRRHGRAAPAVLRLHGHARLEARQQGHPVGGPAHRPGHALRRPRHRHGQLVRAPRPHHPRRRRPLGDRQERGRGRAHRGRRRQRPAGAHRGRARRSIRPIAPSTSPSSPSGARSRSPSPGTARAAGGRAS